MKWIYLLLAGMLAMNAAAQDDAVPTPKRVEIPKISKEITIDGKLDEDTWHQAAVIEDFQENMEGGPAPEASTLHLAYDEENLYLGWSCKDKDILATYTERDASLWDEEVLEFFVAPHEDISRYFELQWNPLNTVFDAIIVNTLDEAGMSESFEGQHDWTAEGMEHGVTVQGTVADPSDTDEGWQVEVAIPFATLESETPAAGDVWRGNFYRYSRTTGEEVVYVAWSPTYDHYHQPSRFGYLVFQNSAAE